VLPWIVGALALATISWFAVRPILRDSARDWNQPTLPPAHPENPQAAAADELRSWIEDGVCPECGALSLSGDEIASSDSTGLPTTRLIADCEECEFEQRLDVPV
jgi:hypothetical protein